MQKEIFYKLVAESAEKMEKLHKSIDFEILIYYFKGSTKDIDFNDLIDVETISDDKKLKRIRFEDAEKNQKEFKSKLSSAKIGGNKLDEQLNTIDSITKFYNSREEVIRFYSYYLKMVRKAVYDAKHG